MLHSETLIKSNYTGMQLNQSIWFDNHTKLYSDYHAAAFINLMFDLINSQTPFENPAIVFTYGNKVTSNEIK